MTHGRVFNSPNDHSPLVHIVAWMGIVISTFALLARIGTKIVLQNKVEWDDGFIMAAFVGSSPPWSQKAGWIGLIRDRGYEQAMAIVQTVAISCAASRGLGKRIENLESSQVDLFEKV